MVAGDARGCATFRHPSPIGPRTALPGIVVSLCNAQLRAFQRAGDTLADVGVIVAALSVDNEETTAALIAKLRVTFPVGYGADAHKVAEVTGAFVNPDPLYLQSTGFVLDPEGKVVVSVYSGGAIGRLVPEDVAGLVRYLREHAM
jgi:peroxiredoxin